MRRTDREVADRREIIEIIAGCDSMALALNDGDYPYVIEMNFGFEDAGKKLILYFHGAKAGKKHELIARDNRAAFAMSRAHKYVPGKNGCSATFMYESACGRGKLRKLEDAEAARALGIIMRHYEPESDYEFSEKHARAVWVYALDVEELTGKRRLVK